jgi:hypothetical protein
MNFVNVTWYYGFVAMVGLAVLSAASLTSLWNRGYRRAAAGLAVATFGYYGCFLGMYCTTAHGDRPRWGDAARFVRDEYGVRPGSPVRPKLYANVPGPVAFYLGEHPSKYEPSRVVVGLPERPADLPDGGIYVVEERSLSPTYLAWFVNHCDLKARFEAHTGPADRSVSVYEGRSPRPTPPAVSSTR